MGEIAEAFRTGGIWMYVILANSIIAIAVTIERFIYLFFKYSVNAEPFMAQIQKLVMANNIDRAIKLCNAQPAAALPRSSDRWRSRSRTAPAAGRTGRCAARRGRTRSACCRDR